MTDRDVLLAAVLNRPDDDTPRLMFADWLGEQSDAGDQALGRFVWAGVTAAKYRAEELIEAVEFYTALRELTAVAAAGHPARWLAALGLGPSPQAGRNWGWDNTADRVTVRVGAANGVFERGMLTRLRAGFDAWFYSARAVLGRWPLAWVDVTDVPGLGFRIGPASIGWRLTAVLRVPARRFRLTGGPLAAALAPGPVLVEPSQEWTAGSEYATREELVSVTPETARRLADELLEQAGDDRALP